MQVERNAKFIWAIPRRSLIYSKLLRKWHIVKFCANWAQKSYTYYAEVQPKLCKLRANFFRYHADNNVIMPQSKKTTLTTGTIFYIVTSCAGVKKQKSHFVPNHHNPLINNLMCCLHLKHTGAGGLLGNVKSIIRLFFPRYSAKLTQRLFAVNGKKHSLAPLHAVPILTT